MIIAFSFKQDVSSDLWKSIFYLKDYIPIGLIFYKSATSFISLQDKRALILASLVLCIRVFTEIGYINGVVDISSYFWTAIYILAIIISLLIIIIKDVKRG